MNEEQKEIEENEKTNEVVPIPVNSSLLRCYKDSRGVLVLKLRLGKRM